MGAATCVRERASQKIYEALARREKNQARRSVLFKLAESEARHRKLWGDRLIELGAKVPIDRDSPTEVIWRWLLAQSGTENALKRIEDAEDDQDDLFPHGHLPRSAGPVVSAVADCA